VATAASDDTNGVRDEKAEKLRKNPASHKLYAATLKGSRGRIILAGSLIRHFLYGIKEDWREGEGGWGARRFRESAPAVSAWLSVGGKGRRAMLLFDDEEEE
jgi:hypothetical protein